MKRVLDKTYANSTYKVKGKGAVKVRVPKRVKVSPKLKAKIMKVIDKKVQHINGTVTDVYLGGKMSCIDREQNVVAGLGSLNPTSWHFTLPMFLDAASVLFNGKAPYFPGPAKYDVFSTVNNFDVKTIKFEVNDSYSTYTFKNSSQHEVKLIIVVGVPKRKGCGVEWDESLSAQNYLGQVIGDTDAIVPVGRTWRNGLIIDTLDTYVIPGWSPHNQGLNGASIIQTPSVEDIFRMPQSCKSLTTKFSIETIELTILPGQTVNHKLQGPKKLLIDFQKQINTNGLVMNIQKYSRSVCGILYNSPNAIATYDPSTGLLTGASVGRFADKIDNAAAGFDIHVERTDYFSIKMPEQAGFNYPTTIVAGAPQPLNNRKSRTNYNVYDVGKNVPTAPIINQVIDLSVMNPQQPVAAASGPGT